MNDAPPTNPPAGKPAKLRTAPRPCIAAMVLTLLAGAIIGAGLTIIVRPGRSPRGRRSVVEMRDRMTAEFARKLDLTDLQQAQVSTILEARLTDVRQIQEQIRPQMRDQAVLLNAKVYEVLDNDQREKWRKFYAELERRWFGPPPATQPAEKQPGDGD